MAEAQLREEAERLQAEIDRLTAELAAATPRQAPAVHNVAVKIGPFWKQNAKLWFKQLEAQFQLARITQSETKYYHVIAKMDADVLQCCSDLIQSFENSAETDKYEKLKTRIVSEYTMTESVRMQMLFQQCELGDRKPSQLLRELRTLAAGVVTDENLIRKIWLQRLPETTQAVLRVLADTIDVHELATKADQLFDITKSSTTSVMTIKKDNPSELQLIQEQIQTLNAEIAAIRRDRGRSYGQQSNRNPSSKGKEHQDPEICFYHRRFGKEARRCRSPCKFSPKN